MVAIPQSADQPTIAEYVESVWEIGLRMRLDHRGSLRREEVEYRKNVAKWMAKAKEGPRTGTLQSSQPSIHQVIKRPVQ
jgi:hypothetical protein